MNESQNEFLEVLERREDVREKGKKGREEERGGKEGE